ncbi:MAG: elongation factor G [Acidimicrobiales bacterium]
MRTLAISSPKQIRNVALIGHGGSGKTTLAESLLHLSGAITRQGRVEDGTTVSDFEPEEVKRHMSVSLAIAPLDWDGFKVNVIDTPGFADFVGEVELALDVCDVAVLVVSAVDGVEVQTEAVWRLAESRNLPRVVFINKLDRERADFTQTLDSLRERFGAGIAPLELPIGHEAAFKGVADLLADEAILYEAGKRSSAPIPDDMAELEHRVRDNLVEGIVVADDSMMERYLEGDVPSAAELESTLADGVAAGTVYPVLCGSAVGGVGLDRLLTFITEIPPNRKVRARAGDKVIEIGDDASAEPLARVFKTTLDPFVGRISLVQVVSGTLKPDIVLFNPRTRAEERLHVLETIRGKETTPVPHALAGDIVAVPKLAETRTGDTLAPKGSPVVIAFPEPTTPMYSIAARPRTAGDEDRMMTGLQRLQEEDPSISVRRNDETHQTVLSGMGETHIQVTCERLHRKFTVDLELEELRVPFRETITKPADAEGRHKKQTGGHGQFGVVHLIVEPLDRGGGFEFVDKIVGGAIPRQFIPAVEKGVRRAMGQGGHFGFPVVDVRVTCDDGKYHTVDSSEASFEMAGALGFGLAFEKAAPVALEPIDKVVVTCPMRFQGDVLGDLNSRRGRVLGSSADGTEEQTIEALVPESELGRYAADLRSLTGGRGRFAATFDHYAELPAHLAERLEKKRAASAN